MLEQASSLSAQALDAIAELERRVVEADGGRLKLEWGRLRSRTGDRIEDLLWWEGERIVGFLGLYGYGSTLELSGMVAPDRRRRGIAAALLDAAMPLFRDRQAREALLIVPRPSEAGKRLALGRGAMLHHSEHALVLCGEPSSGPPHPALSLRPATAVDLPAVSRVLAAAFDEPAPDGLGERLDTPGHQILVAEVDGSVLGTLRTTRDAATDARIYGFAVDPSQQGRGIGRSALRLACQQLRAEGAQRIGLEVAVDNDRALGLYTSIGFAPVITEDYYALPMSGFAQERSAVEERRSTADTV